MILRGYWGFSLLLLALGTRSVLGQIDPENRRLLQLGYNQSLEGRGPIAAYGFFYYNRPSFLRTNMTLRLAAAPIYLDADLGFTGLLGPNTDLSLGLAGGAYGDSYSEIRAGKYRRDESFLGHGGELNVSLYHRFNPEDRLPLWLILRGAARHSTYLEDSETEEPFELPDDHETYRLRVGARLGGHEPTMTAPLGFEVSLWHETIFRSEAGAYGFGDDRSLEEVSHFFWGRTSLRYTFEPSLQQLDLGLVGGTSIHSDRLNVYRLGSFLPFVAEFPLSLPGYYFQELSSERFLLLNGQYSVPLDADKAWSFTGFAATAVVDYLDGLEQPGSWHSGAGAGISWTSPHSAWFVTLLYAHGFDAIRENGRGANSVGLLLQYDFEAKVRPRTRRFQPELDPTKSRGGERMIRR